MKRLIAMLAVFAGGACVAFAAGSDAHGKWLDDFAAAKAKSKETGRPILADFSGSDWCGWCIRLEKEVFSQEAFKTYASTNLVLFLADFPHGKRLPVKVAKQNEGLQGKYGIEGFPTVLLLDADGEVLGRTGYQPGGPTVYVEQLKGMLDKAGWHAPQPPAVNTNAPAFKPAPVYKRKASPAP